MELRPSFKIPARPSPKSKAKDHIKAVADELRRKWGEDEVLKVELVLYTF